LTTPIQNGNITECSRRGTAIEQARG